MAASRIRVRGLMHLFVDGYGRKLQVAVGDAIGEQGKDEEMGIMWAFARETWAEAGGNATQLRLLGYEKRKRRRSESEAAAGGERGTLTLTEHSGRRRRSYVFAPHGIPSKSSLG